MNQGMVLMWRLGLGRWAETWPSVAGRMLIVEHHGRKTGNRYLTPLNFATEHPSRYCLAAFGSEADWYRNVFAARRTVLWLPDGKWTAVATDVTGEAGLCGLIRQVLVDSGFAARVFDLNPGEMTDIEIDAATSGYRLVRFELIDRCDQNPADLSWVWVPDRSRCGDHRSRDRSSPTAVLIALESTACGRAPGLGPIPLHRRRQRTTSSRRPPGTR